MNDNSQIVKPARLEKTSKGPENGGKVRCRDRAFSKACDPKMRNVGVQRIPPPGPRVAGLEDELRRSRPHVLCGPRKSDHRFAYDDVDEDRPDRHADDP
ncbi:MAG TPA: hypothetical protein VKB71_11275, partial [Rhizomicrobium sp.]|nr:hypothetical protein [Rhizomicrobium sp.]